MLYHCTDVINCLPAAKKEGYAQPSSCLCFLMRSTPTIIVRTTPAMNPKISISQQKKHGQCPLHQNPEDVSSFDPESDEEEEPEEPELLPVEPEDVCELLVEVAFTPEDVWVAVAVTVPDEPDEVEVASG